MADKKQLIKIEKTVYGNKSLGSLIDRSFNSIGSTKEKKDVSGFFKSYEELFYDIPQEGANSHTSLIEDSKEYVSDYKDPKDDEIAELVETIAELEVRIDELENPDENPFFKNGTVLAPNGWGNFYYMDKGKRRALVGGRAGETWKALKASLGFKEIDNDFKDGCVVSVPSSVVYGIKEGPYLDIEDLSGTNPQTIREVKIKLDPSDWKANPDKYDSVEDYEKALEKEIREAWNLERGLEHLWNKYNNQRSYGDTADDRAEGKRLFEETKIELKQSRFKLAKYKRIYEAIKSDVNITLTGIDSIYESLFESDMEDDYIVSKEERQRFWGWEKGAFGDIKTGTDEDGQYYTFG